MRSTIDRFSQSLVDLLVNLMGQSLIYKKTFPTVLFDSDLSFVCKVTSYVALGGLTN